MDIYHIYEYDMNKSCCLDILTEKQERAKEEDKVFLFKDFRKIWGKNYPHIFLLQALNKSYVSFKYT